MTVYPDVITGVPSTLPLEYSTEQAVLATEFENGRETRRLLWGSHRRSVKLKYSVVEYSYANELRRFYESVQGSFQSFSFFFPNIEYYVKELVGVASGGETSLKLPSKGAQGYTLYRGNNPLSPGTDYTFVSSGGPDGEDLANLNFTAVAGDRYSFTFTGRLKIKARFSNSPFIASDVKTMFSVITVNITGLLPSL